MKDNESIVGMNPMHKNCLAWKVTQSESARSSYRSRVKRQLNRHSFALTGEEKRIDSLIEMTRNGGSSTAIVHSNREGFRNRVYALSTKNSVSARLSKLVKRNRGDKVVNITRQNDQPEEPKPRQTSNLSMQRVSSRQDIPYGRVPHETLASWSNNGKEFENSFVDNQSSQDCLSSYLGVNAPKTLFSSLLLSVMLCLSFDSMVVSSCLVDLFSLPSL